MSLAFLAVPRLAAPRALAAPARTLYVRVTGASPSAAMEKLNAKVAAEGRERLAAARKRYVKPHLQRQLDAKGAVYNKAKRERVRVVEELMLDRKVCPF